MVKEFTLSHAKKPSSSCVVLDEWNFYSPKGLVLSYNKSVPMYFSHFASYLALMIILISIALSLVYMLCGFSLHYLCMCSSSEPTTTNIKWKNCIIWYYLCINVAIDEVIYGTSSTPEKQRSTTKQQHHLKIRQMSRNCRQANRPEPNQLHMKRMHIYPIHWIESNQAFFFLFLFFYNLPHTRPSKEPSPNGLIEASETSIRLNMFRQI